MLREPKAESSIPDPQSGKWYIRLDQTITKLKLGSAFGAPLEVLLEKEQSSIPCVVLDSVAYIQKCTIECSTRHMNERTNDRTEPTTS